MEKDNYLNNMPLNMVTTLHNFMYFGCERETDLLSGHLKLHIRKNDFAVLELHDYGGLTYIGKKLEVPEITDSMYRQIHDSILDKFGSSVEEEDRKEGYQYFPRHERRISANIGFGDHVTHAGSGETFVVGLSHDLKYINRNQFYYPTERPEFKPKPFSREKYIELISKINPFDRWEVCEKPQPNKWYRMFGFKVGDKQVTAYSHYQKDTYYIDLNGTVYDKRSNISAPFYDAIEILRGDIFVEYEDGKRITYVLSEIESDEKYFRPVVFTEEYSLHYNNSLIEKGINI